MNIDQLISHPDKVFWPDEGYTKLDLARFYESVFSRLKPYVDDRLLTMERCPDGMLGQCFYQKKAPKGLPTGTPTKLIHHESGDVNYVVGGSLDTQIALVNFGCIPVHVWGSRAKNADKPDWMIFDLDPGSGKFADSAIAGLLFKKALDEIGLTSFPKTSGSRGLHVFVPLRSSPNFDQVREFAAGICQQLAAKHPDTLTMEQRINARKGRVFLDFMRNSFGATAAAPYSVRRRAKASFSMPLLWKDVKPNLDPSEFNLGNYKKHLAKADAWKDFFKHRQSLKLS